MISLVPTGPKTSVWQRDRIVGRRTSGLPATRMNWENAGGSSRIFSEALAAAASISEASSTRNTRLRPIIGFMRASSIARRI